MTLSEIRVTELALVVCLHMTKGDHARMENRPENGLILADSGILSFDYLGHTYSADTDTALAVPSGIDYIYHCDETGVFYVVNFKTTQPFPTSKFSHFDVSNIRIGLINTVRRMYYSWIYEKPACALVCIGLLYQLLSSLEMLANGYIPVAKQKLVENAFEYILQHLHDPDISNATLSKRCGISDTYFRSLFTQMYQISPMQYVKRRRIQEAQNMLASGDMSVSEVAEAVGYSSIYSFSKAFKTSTGLSPSDYIQYIRNHV